MCKLRFKIIPLFVLMLMLFSSVYATDIYVSSKSNNTYFGYDKDSVHVELYDPPNYVIDVDVYQKNLVNEMYFLSKVRFFYNWDTKVMQARVRAMTSKHIDGGKWDEWAYAPLDEPAKVVPPHTNFWYIGNRIFNQAYNMYFDYSPSGKSAVQDKN